MRRAGVLVALFAAVLLTGCGGSGGAVGNTGQGPLRWADEPMVFTPDTLPGDRILTGYLRNDSVRRVRVDLPDVRVLARNGDVVRASPVFLNTFGKNLWSPGRGPTQMPDSELVRTGRIAYLKPGEQIPFTVAWHAKDGAPEVVDYGAGSLRVPG